ncbi:MAG TPA: hypothetical protein VMX16_18090 [Terriglobia bacterium]|nr:hypothetical protein [Terriglobia bacterium]
MKALTKEQAQSWCKARSLTVTGDDYLYFPESRRCIAIELPTKPYELVALANALLPYSEASPFQGALLWIRQWGVWNELVERAGFRVMEIMRRLHGDARRPEEAPGYLFDAQELVDLQVCLIQPLLIGWDAFMVPESGDYIVATSHDETTCVLARTPQIHERMLAELQSWNPREDQEWYFKGTAIPATHS